MDIPTDVWRHLIAYAIHSMREEYENRCREWEEQARLVNEDTTADVWNKLLGVDASGKRQVIIKDAVLPENTIVSIKRTSKLLCHLVNTTEEWWKRIYHSVYNAHNWYNISGFGGYQEALNTLKKVSASIQKLRNRPLQALYLPFQYDLICCITDGHLIYVRDGQILSRKLIDPSASPTFFCNYPAALGHQGVAISNVFKLKDNLFALECLKERSPATIFLTKEGESLMETVHTIQYHDNDLLLLEFWDEQVVHKVADLSQLCYVTDLVPLRNTRIFDCRPLGEFGYLSRTTGVFVPVIQTRTQILEVSTRELMERRYSQHFSDKLLFYVMSPYTHVLVHDIYVTEENGSLLICENKWNMPSGWKIQNVALVRNRMIILICKEDTEAEKNLLFVDL